MRRSAALLAVIAALAVLIAAAPAQAAGGDLDPTFSGDGKATTGLPSTEGVARQSTGKIVTAGGSAGTLQLARHTATGALDATWDGNGHVTIAVPGLEQVVGLGVQRNDKLVVFARGPAGTGLVVRLTADGKRDLAYDGDGRRETALPSAGVVRDGALDSAGRAVLLAEGSDRSAILARHTSTNGALDTAFGGDGIVQNRYAPVLAPALAAAADGKLVVAGDRFGDGALVSRYTAAGAPDPTFAGDGHRELAGGSLESEVAVDAAGRAVVALFEGPIDGRHPAHHPVGAVYVRRLTPGGAVDETFGDRGLAWLEGWIALGDLAVQDDGKPVLGGSAQPPEPDAAAVQFRLTRLTAAGQPDGGFAPGGTVLTPFTRDAAVRALVIPPDRTIVAAGPHGPGLAVARYVGARASDTDPPAVTITPPATTKGAVTFAFSEEVRGVAAQNAVLRWADTRPNLPGTLRCSSASGAAVDCLAGPVRRATLTPPWVIPGGAYRAVANPPDVPRPIRDAAGNVLPTTSLAFRGDISIEEDDALVADTWPTLGNVHRERTPGASASFAFTGTGANLNLARGRYYGRARIYVDGAFAREVDNYWPTPYSGYTVHQIPIGPLAPGAHTVRVEPTGTRAPEALGFWVGVSSLHVSGEEYSRDPTDTAWAVAEPAGASGGRVKTSTPPDGRLSVSFWGDSVDVRMRVGPDQGRGRISLDGRSDHLFDNYAPEPGWVTRSLTGLATDHGHSLSVVPNGFKAAASTGTGVTVDRFDIG